MKCFNIVAGALYAAMVTAHLTRYGLEFDIGSILLARRSSNYVNLFPRAYRGQPRITMMSSNNGSGPPRRPPPPHHEPSQNGVPPYLQNGKPHRVGIQPQDIASRKNGIQPQNNIPQRNGIKPQDIPPRKLDIQSQKAAPRKVDSPPQEIQSQRAAPRKVDSQSQEIPPRKANSHPQEILPQMIDGQSKDAPPSKPDSKPQSPGAERSAKAMVHAKDPATVYVAHPRNFRDAFVKFGDNGGIRIEHDHSVTAGGVVGGNPLPNADKTPPHDHPLRAQGQARAVMGQVSAPKGGSGSITIETPERKQEIYVPGGAASMGAGVAKKADGVSTVVTTVTHGGAVRVAAGPDRDTVEQ